MTEEISAQQFHEAAGIEDWRVLTYFHGACAHFNTGSFAAGVALVEAIGELAGAVDHHADVVLPPAGVTVRLQSSEWALLRDTHVELTRPHSAAAREMNLPDHPPAHTGYTLANAIRATVAHVVATLKRESSIIAQAAATGALQVVGAHYSLSDGSAQVLA